MKKWSVPNYINKLSGQNQHIMHKGGKDKGLETTFYRGTPKGLLRFCCCCQINV